MATLTLIFAVMAPVALAQSGKKGYRAEGPSILDQTQGNGNDGANPSSDNGTSPSNDQGNSDNVPRAAASGDSLPFTGLDIGLVAVAGASLVLMGVGMRRLTRAPDSV